MKNFTIFISFLVLTIGGTTAQELEAIQSPILGSVKISKAEVVSDNPERLNLSFTYSVNNGKNYLIQGTALDQNKKPLEDIFVEPQELAGGSGLVDLSFRFKKVSQKKYTNPVLNSAYISIKMVEKKGEGNLMDLLSPNNKSSKLEEALAIKYEYKLKKEWRVGCTSGMVITAKLKPIGKAILIKK